MTDITTQSASSTGDAMTPEKLSHWLAGRKEAGQNADIETCEVGKFYVQTMDPYGVDPNLPEELQQIGGLLFVCSPQSNGWICVYDLPPAKRDALYERIKREPLVLDDGLF